MKEIILLGSTGSVGRSVLDIVRRFPDRFRVKAISSYSNNALLARQVHEFGPEKAVIADERAYKRLAGEISGETEILCGEDSLQDICEEKADIVFMAVSGTAALRPLFSAIRKGRTIALASKEPVVSAGRILKEEAAKSGAVLIPVDSEHSAVMQSMASRTKADIRSVFITGSGGPLKDVPEKEFTRLTVEQVLDHPKWDMGPKITVDSATLMNKGLEVIEARWLFDIEPSRIKVLIHPEAIVHALVEFNDGTVSAAMFPPDMRFPIIRALSYPEIITSDLERLDLLSSGSLTFSAPDRKKFPAIDIAYNALNEGGTCPAALNGANEAAVSLFLSSKIGFTEIIPAVDKILRSHDTVKDPDLQDIINAEVRAKEEVLSSC